MLVSLRGFNGNRKMILALVVRMLLDKKTRNSKKVEFNKKFTKKQCFMYAVGSSIIEFPLNFLTSSWIPRIGQLLEVFSDMKTETEQKTKEHPEHFG